MVIAGGKVIDQVQSSRLLSNQDKLQSELTTLQEAHSRNITPEEKRMVYEAINLTGSGYSEPFESVASCASRDITVPLGCSAACTQVFCSSRS